MLKKEIQQTATTRAKKLILEQGGMIKTSESIKMGIHPRTLYLLRDTGEVEEISRGLYRLSSMDPISNPDFFIVASRLPQAVICLISALVHYELTTQIPHAVFIALAKGAETPRMDYPPVSVHRFSKESFNTGIEAYEMDGVSVRIYGPEKTLADCFKFRNKIGMDVVLEALKFYKKRRRIKLDELLKYAKICRVKQVMMPYLETII